MATLAPSTSDVPNFRETPSFGTAADGYGGGDLHGRDFKAVRRFVLRERVRSRKLGGRILSEELEDGLTYNSVPPFRTFQVDAVFERGGRITPIPFDLDDE